MTVINMAQRALSSSITGAGRRGRSSFSPRILAPFALIPIGAVYCQTHVMFFEDIQSSLGESLVWALTTLMPWVVAVLIFEARVVAGERRHRIVQRALLLGTIAYGASAMAALLQGSDSEQAFFSRVPLLAVAMLCAILYPIPMPAESRGDSITGEDVPPVAPAEIVFARAAGNYIELHAGGRTLVWRQTMHNAERILGPGFVRVHRSYLVPWRSIDTVTRGRKGPVEVALHNGACLPVSNRYAANLHS